jgi:hypothetical protein
MQLRNLILQDFRFSLRQKTITALSMVVAFVGLMNLLSYHCGFLHLSSKQIAILSFFPLAIVTYLILHFDRFR